MHGRRFDVITRGAGSRRNAVQALAAIVMGGMLPQLAPQTAVAGCKKVGGRCRKRKRCCKGSTCKRGRCRCARGRRDCDGNGRCKTRVQADPNNCGACGATCADDQQCKGGRCVCVDLSRTCGDTCCSEFQECCGTDCRNLQGDEQNCGACGVVCEVNERCIAGECRNVEL